MSRSAVPFHSRNWSRIAVLAAVGLTAAGCADSARFASNTPPADVTGSIPARPRATPHVASQPLPPPVGSVASEPYRPTPRPEYTGTVAARPAPAPVQPQGHWTWDGGQPVVVGRHDTLESIARHHGVPASAIVATNSLHGAVRPGQRLVIPRYVVGAAHTAPIARPAVQAEAPRMVSARRPEPKPEPRVASQVEPSTGDIHVVQPGENLIGIARRHGVSVAELARANHIEPYAKVAMGDRLTIPGRARAAHVEQPRPVERQVVRAEPPRVAPPQVAAPRTASVEPPRERAQMVQPEAVAQPEPEVKKAEPVGHVPSFRWPVTGHIVEAFGPRPNGTTNDGINFAVPEGTPIRAAEDGVVAYAGNELKTFGNLVLIRHADNYVTAYANASSIQVKRGDTVRRGQIIAHSGQTGNASIPQLHFEIRKNSSPIDPRKLLASK